MKISNPEESKFYTYVYLDPRKPGRFTYGDFVTFFYEPFYVGKGKGNRIYKHLRHDKILKRNNIEKYNNIQKIRNENFEPKNFIIKLIDNINEKCSLCFEVFLIVFIGRKDLNNGTLLNHTNGGDGVIGRNKLTKESKNKIGIKNKINSSMWRWVSNLKTKEMKRVHKDYLDESISYNNYINNIKSIDNNLFSDSENVDTLTKLKKEKVKNSSLNMSLLEFYRKFANPLACIIFVIFACPIGLFTRKAGYQIGFIIGLFLTAFYWFSFMGTWTLGQRFLIIPIIAMSLPNLIFLILGLLFLIKRLKE